MPIIDARGGGGLSRLPDTLLKIMVHKQQLEQAKEEQGLRAKDHAMRVEAFEFEQAQAQAQQEAAASLLPSILGSLSPNVTQGLPPIGQMDPAQQAALVEQLKGFVEFQQTQDLRGSQIAGLTAETALRNQEFARNADTFALQDELTQANLDLTNAQTADIAAGAQTRINNLKANQRDAASNFAQRQFSAMQNLIASGLEPSQASAMTFGTPSPPDPNAVIQEQLEFLQSGGTKDTAISARLSRAAGAFGLGGEEITQLLNDLVEAENDPQKLVDELFKEEDLDDATKGTILQIIRAGFPGAQLSEPEGLEEDSPIRRLWTLLFNPGTPIPGGNLSPRFPASP